MYGNGMTPELAMRKSKLAASRQRLANAKAVVEQEQTELDRLLAECADDHRNMTNVVCPICELDTGK